MREIAAKEARNHLSHFLDRVEKGEEIVIVRRGKKVARLVTAESTACPPPDLSAFRAGIKIKGESLTKTLINLRTKERF